LLAEIDASGNPTRSYLWGPDLSGTLDGAGGIGGLLMDRDHAGGTYHFAGSDGNGNVTVLINAANQSTSACYEYSPYGELLRATGPMASLNSIGWSSKYYDRETRLSNYGERLYSAISGRWFNRDPSEETGSQNLYSFVENNPINSGMPWA
jgi:RHS repeat-associated protein